MFHWVLKIMKLKIKERRDYEDDGLLPFSKYYFFAINILHDCWSY